MDKKMKNQEEVIMDKKPRGFFNMRIVFGLLIIAAGVLLLLNSMDLGVAIDIGDYWPVILIVIGLGKIVQPRHSRQLYWGIVIGIVGVLFLLNNLGYLHFWFKDLWPVILILLGIEILRCGAFRHRIRVKCFTNHDKKFVHHHEHLHSGCCTGGSDSRSIDSDVIDISVMFGGGEYRFTSKNLKGGRVSTVMGGCELDFSQAEMEENEMVLETSTVMGGIELHVPAHWQVVLEGSPILGGLDDTTIKPENPQKKLIIKGSAVLGAVEVKN
jgi:predicted membrane protein